MAFTILLLLYCTVRAVGLPTTPSNIQIKLPNGPNQQRLVTIDKAFIGLGIESASFPDYSDEVSQRLVKNLQDKTKGDFYIRVGGTSL